jgi:DNA-binding response OmpR family regulator
VATILVVEPSRNLRLLVEEELAALGHTVHAIASTIEARACIAEERPNLMILAAALEEAEGLQLLGHLLGTNPDMPIIIYTGNADLADGILAALADACVLKSSNVGPLLAAVQRVLRRTELFSAPWRTMDLSAELIPLASGRA